MEPEEKDCEKIDEKEVPTPKLISYAELYGIKPAAPDRQQPPSAMTDDRYSMENLAKAGREAQAREARREANRIFVERISRQLQSAKTEEAHYEFLMQRLRVEEALKQRIGFFEKLGFPRWEIIHQVSNQPTWNTILAILIGILLIWNFNLNSKINSLL